jgi:GLPGLI family protein
MDFNENRKTTANDVFGEAFLITDTIKKYTWTLVDETKKVAGLLCKKATTITKTFRQGMRIIDTKKVADASNVPSTKPEETEIVAWYAIDLVSSSGPESYTGLPGVILELDVDNGGTNFVAKEIRPLTDINQLKPPKKGRKVTPEEYNKEIKKIVENMGSGPIQIKSGM